MGNRCVITTAPFDEKNIGIYLHWNGGQESVEAFLGAAKELGYRCPVEDSSYGLARLVGLISLYFGIIDSTSIGIGRCEELDCDGDNGVWLVKAGWQLAGQPGKRKRKNPEPERTHQIQRQLVVGARVCATAFTESGKMKEKW